LPPLARPLTVAPVAEPTFEERRSAQLYDPLDPDRSDLDVYAAMASEFGALSVLDIGCGTGTFACLLARRGLTVTGVDPDAASLEVARAKPGAGQVRWIHGYAADLPELPVDLATMTANVAQAITTDAGWNSTLSAAFAALRPGDRLIFETRRPEVQAWLSWNREDSFVRTDVPAFGIVEHWYELIDVTGPLVTFRGTCAFADGTRQSSTSTLRFRTQEEVSASLTATGYVIDEIRDAPDRPGRELVFIARRP
jgi:SAM-dependent methyltransferase